MITDSDTDLVYLSEILRSHEKFFGSLISILAKNNIEFKFLPDTRDIWAVDYMPVQIDVNKFIQFKYEPDYLQNGDFILTQTDPKSVCKIINLITTESKVKVDGGNVIKGNSWVILTDKVFSENLDLKRNTLLTELENLFGVKVIIIPREPNDFTGHADGMVRYYSNDTVLMNTYKPKEKKDFQRRLTKALKDQGIGTIEIPYNPFANVDNDSADGLYINYLQMNNFILLPTFEKGDDERAYLQFQELFPGQIIDTIDSREISRYGGVLNCITWNVKNGPKVHSEISGKYVFT